MYISLWFGVLCSVFGTWRTLVMSRERIDRMSQMPTTIWNPHSNRQRQSLLVLGRECERGTMEQRQQQQRGGTSGDLRGNICTIFNILNFR